MEDNAASHKHYYHNKSCQFLDLQKLDWPASSPDLNPIEKIWMERKDKIKTWLGWNLTAAAIRDVVIDVCSDT